MLFSRPWTLRHYYLVQLLAVLLGFCILHSSAFSLCRRSTVPGRLVTNGFTTATALGPVARNGLAYEDVTIGEGRRILPGDIVKCYYKGSFQKKSSGMFGGIGGTGAGVVTIFDAIQEGEPFAFSIGKGQVIEGWDLGILGKADLEIPPMYVGGFRKLTIPPALAYGTEGNGPIPANQALDFEIQVVNAQPAEGISLEFRLKGYAIALSVPIVLFSIAWIVLHNI